MSYDTENIANNFYLLAVSLAPNPTVKKITPNELKNFYVVWDGETVEELATGKKISVDNWPQKYRKINSICEGILNKKIRTAQILVVKDSKYPEMLIIDGIHRSVGYYKAYLKNSDVHSKTNFTYLFFESDRIHEMYDYMRLFHN